MEINYIIKKSYRHSLKIQVLSDGRVLVKAPEFLSTSEIEKYLLKHKEWITKKIQENLKNSQLVQKNGYYSKKEINAMKRKAKEIIPQRVEYFAKLGGISYNRIFIRLQKTRWGSCSSNGNLNFNCLLVLMPPEILDSVVVHELCHCKFMNHSKDFYAEVYKLFPEYDKCHKWLRENESAYMSRVNPV